MAESKKSIIGNSYVVPYAGNYFDLCWYEIDFCGYFNHLKYQEMTKILLIIFQEKGLLTLT